MSLSTARVSPLKLIFMSRRLWQFVKNLSLHRHCFLSGTSSKVADLSLEATPLQKGMPPPTGLTGLEPPTANQQHEQTTEAGPSSGSQPRPASQQRMEATLEGTSAAPSGASGEDENDIDIVNVPRQTPSETLPPSEGDVPMMNGHQRLSGSRGQPDKGHEADTTLAVALPGDGVQSQLRDLLLHDCMEAMRWCLEKERYYHKVGCSRLLVQTSTQPAVDFALYVSDVTKM